MPRPKPPEPIRSREIRLSDTQMAKFKALGGSKWLRDLLENTALPEPVRSPVMSVWRHIAK